MKRREDVDKRLNRLAGELFLVGFFGLLTFFLIPVALLLLMASAMITRRQRYRFCVFCGWLSLATGAGALVLAVAVLTVGGWSLPLVMLVIAGILGLLASALILPVLNDHAVWRRFMINGVKGRCWKCGYELREAFERCAECGWEIDAEARLIGDRIKYDRRAAGGGELEGR
jgi:hypothetical protein